jgi:hypothetical protein
MAASWAAESASWRSRGWGLAGRQQLGPRGQVEALLVPLIDVQWSIQETVGRGRRRDLDKADFGHPFGMRRDPGAQRARQDLAAQADAEKRPAGLHPAGHPVDLRLQVGPVSVLAEVLGAAIDQGSHMVVRRLRQRVALARRHPFDPVAAFAQEPRGAVVALADRMVDQQDRPAHAGASARRAARKAAM